MKNCSKMVKLKIAFLIPGILSALMVLAVLIISLQLEYMEADAPNILDVQRSEPIPEMLEFPLEVFGTPLVIERTAIYDGPYVEDGTDDEVTGVVAIVLRNNGSEMVLHAEIILEQGSRRLKFYADMIPPGAAILVLEMNRSTYSMSAYTSCTGNVLMEPKPAISNEIKAVSQGMDRISITNQSTQTIYDVEVLYKGWQEDPGVYLGGISYTAHLGELPAGRTAELNPEHFVVGYSRIVQVRYKKTPTPMRRGRDHQRTLERNSWSLGC